MLTGPNVILALKVAVAAVTVILLASLACLVFRQFRWHGRLNVVFFILTVGAVAGLEILIRFVDPHLFDYFDANMRFNMAVHLGFSVPSALLLPVMLVTGWRHHRGHYYWLGPLFLVCWAGTFVTGIFFLPSG
ncbi:MAG: hypothetical protein ACJ8F7_12685 [Gemmataceae bacterium]